MQGTLLLRRGGNHRHRRAGGDGLLPLAALLPRALFKPAVHVNYQETVLRMRDGLPKLRDFPKEFGGSGEVLAE